MTTAQHVLQIAQVLAGGDQRWLNALGKVLRTYEPSQLNAPTSESTTSPATNDVIESSDCLTRRANRLAYTSVGTSPPSTLRQPNDEAARRSGGVSRTPSAKTWSGNTRGKNSHGGTAIAPSRINSSGDTPDLSTTEVLTHPDPLIDELEAGVAAAADHLADLSALYEQLPYASSVADGTYSQVRPVIAEAWALTLHLMIDDGDLDALRGRTVSRRYLHGLVDELAGGADFRTGRNCMPGHVEMGATLGRPIKAAKLAAMVLMTPAARAKAEARIHHDRTRQVYNGIEVLKAACVLVCVEEGRILDYIDRMEQVANGSDRRRARAVYALTLPRDRHPAPRPRPPVDNAARRDGSPEPIFYTPQSGLSSSLPSDSVEAFQSSKDVKPESDLGCGPSTAGTPRLTAAQELQDAAPRRLAPTKRRLWELEEGHFALVVALRRALPLQLAGVSVRKLAGATKRFYEAGWDALSLAAEVVDAYDMMGRHFPAYRPGNPAKWLGWVLKQVDHTVTPAMRRYEDWAAAAATELCPHDWPGGARLSIVTGQPKCPLCRHASQAHS